MLLSPATYEKPSPRSSFTLIELLIVVAVIAVLATVVITSNSKVEWFASYDEPFSRYAQYATLASPSSYTSLGRLLSISRTLRKIEVGETGF